MSTTSAITLEQVSRRYGNHLAVDNVSLTIEAGTVFGLLGPNGAGKTTTIKMLLGLLRPSSGNIRVLGSSIPDQREKIRGMIGVLLENNGVYGRLTIRQNLRFFSEAYGLCDAETRERSKDLLEWLDIAHLLDRTVATLSTGERRKLGIARALIHKPALIVLDEPTIGLDVETASHLRDALIRLVRRDGASVFLTSHHLDDVQRLCDSVAVMRGGAVVAVTSPAELAARSQKPLVNVRLQQSDRRAVDVARALPGVRSVSLTDADLQVTYDDKPDSATLLHALITAGVPVHEVQRHRGEIEEAFLDLVKEEQPR